MGINRIILSESDQGLGQLGGGARLVDIALWPREPETGRLMLPVLMLTAEFLGTAFIPPGMALTVFLAVERDGDGVRRSSLRRLAVHQQSELETTLAQGHSKVLLHALAPDEIVPPDLDAPIPRTYLAKQAFTSEQMSEELDDADSGACISKVLGRPAWLQDPLYESPRYYFLAQLLDADIADVSPRHEGLFGGGIGYLFADNRAKKMKEGDAAGYFLIQFT